MNIGGMDIGDLPNLIILIFGCLVAIFSLGILLFYFVARADNSTNPFHQRLAIMIFSVMVTAMVVLLGALPETQKKVNEVAGNVGALTIYIAGPAAVWAAVFLITTHVFPSKTAAAAERESPLLNDALRIHYRTLGFDYYRAWFAKLNAFRRVIEHSELHFIDDLLPKVFYHGPYGLLKPREVVNSTLFIFSREVAVKLQRIRGVVRTDGDKRSRIYLPHTPSTPGGQISCLHFIRGGNGISQIACHTHGDWKEAPLENIDILLIAVYENDELANGDYVYVDISKYIDLEKMEDASVELAIISDRPMEEFNVWEVSASLASTEKPVPLMFRNLNSQIGRRTAAEVDRNREQVAQMFDGWGKIIDQALAGRLGQPAGMSRDEVESFLLKVKGTMSESADGAGPTSFQELFRTLPAEDCVFSRLKRQHNVILSTFAWE